MMLESAEYGDVSIIGTNAKVVDFIDLEGWGAVGIGWSTKESDSARKGSVEPNLPNLSYFLVIQEIFSLIPLGLVSSPWYKYKPRLL